MAAQQPTNKPEHRRRRRTGTIVLISLAGLLVVAAVLLAFAPALASGFVRTMAQDGINDEIQGRATIARTSLSWRGPQRIGPIEIVDPDGRPVANITVESSRGLLSMIAIATGLAPPDLGTTTVIGRAVAIRRPDGTINLQDVLQPRPDEPPEDIFLPPGLTAHFVLNGVELTFIDERQLAAGAPAAVIRLPALAGEARLVDARRVEASVASPLLYGPSMAMALHDGGEVRASLSADDLTEPDGRVALQQARFSAAVEAVDVSTVIADALAEMEGRLVEAAGEQMRAELRVDGTLAAGRLQVSAESRGMQADVQLETVDGVLRTPRPGVITIGRGAAVPLIPGFTEAVAAQDDVTFEQFPGATVTLDDVNVPLPLHGRSLDLRGATFRLSLETGETIGQVRIPSPDGTPGPPREYRLAPLIAELSSAELAQHIALRARTSATLGGESAGGLEVDLVAIEPLDEAGRPRPVFARDVAGSAQLSGFATVILQPFAEAMGIRMAEDVGPELNFALRAEASPDAGGGMRNAGPGGPALPPTRLTFTMSSANISAVSAFILHNSVLQSDQRDAVVRIGTLAPLLSRTFAQQGLLVEQGAGVTLTASDVRIDFDRLFAEEPDTAPAAEAPAPAPDLRAVAGHLRLETTPSSGRLILADQPQRPWEVAPAIVEVNAGDITQGVRLRAQTNARLAGQPAGTLDADLRITQLLTPDGRPAPGLPAVEGRAALTEIATVLVQPLIDEMGVDLRRGAGPHLDVVLRASTEAVPASSDAAFAMPRTSLDVTLMSRNLRAVLPLELDGAIVRTRGDGLSVRSSAPGALLGSLARDAGLDVTSGGFLRILGRDLVFDMDAPREAILLRAAGELELAMGGFAILPVPEPDRAAPQPIELGQMFFTLRLAPEHTPVLALRGSIEHEGISLATRGELQLVGLETMDPAQVRPTGELVVRNLPTSLLAFVAAADPDDPFDLVRLARDLAGPAVTITLTSQAVPEQHAQDRRITLTARSQRFTSDIEADLAAQSLDLRRFDASAMASPELAGTVLEMALGEQVATPPRVTAPAQLNIAIEPLSIPLIDGFVPDFAGAGDIAVAAALPGPLMVDDLVLAAMPDQPPRPIGALGLEDFNFGARFPLTSLAPGAPPARTTFDLSGTVLGAPAREDNRLMHITARGEANVADAQPVDRMTAQAQLAIADGWRLDEILGQDGMLAQGIGARDVTISARAVVDFPPPGAASGGFAFDRARVTLNLRSPRLTMAEPAQLEMLPDRITLLEPVTINWQMHQNWANRILMGIEAGAPAPTRFVDWMPLRLAITELTLSRGPDIGLFLPGLFRAEGQITSPGTPILVGGERTALSDVTLHAVAGHQPGAVGFDLRVLDAGGGPGPDGEPAVRFSGGIYHIADAQGRFDRDATLMTVDGRAYNIPTAIVDGLAAQRGLLVDGLGPLINLTLDGRGLAEGRGRIRALATSQRARAEISGIIQGMNFVTDEPAEFQLLAITPDMGQRLAGGLPLVGHLEKTTAEEPAVVRATNLVVPLDGDLRRLNAQIMFDPGEARFAISRPFAPVLRMIDEPREAIIGRRLQPISLAITDGVLTYDRFDVPVGVFTFSMEGTVDLATRELDVLTFVPFGALTEEVAGELRTGLGGLLGVVAPTLDRLTMVPLRARGTFDEFSVEPDMRLLARELQRELVRPDRILGGTARDLLDRLINNNRREQPKEEPR